MFDPFTVLVTAATFLLAGTVKGVIGLGLPTVSLALLTATVGLTEAMALLIAPSLVTNVWQAVVGGHGRAILKRLWPFLATAGVTIWIGALALTRVDLALTRVDLALLSALLGSLIVVYAGLSLTRPHFTVAPRQEPWLGPLLGTTNGVFTGMTGSFVVPGVMYLQALGLPRDMLIQAMGILFLISTAALGIALGGNGLMTGEESILSFLAVAPALIGMVAGQKIRKRLSEERFRRVFFSGLLVVGAYIVVRAFT